MSMALLGASEPTMAIETRTATLQVGHWQKLQLYELPILSPIPKGIEDLPLF